MVTDDNAGTGAKGRCIFSKINAMLYYMCEHGEEQVNKLIVNICAQTYV